MRVKAISLLALVYAPFSFGLDETPYFAASWRSELSIPPIQILEPKDLETHERDGFQIKLSKTTNSCQLIGLTLKNDTLQLASVRLDKKIEKAEIKAVAIVDIPDGFENFKVKMKRQRVETDLPPQENIAFVVESPKDAPALKLRLPRKLQFVWRKGWELEEREGVLQALEREVEDKLTDQALAAHWGIQTVNIPAPLDAFLKWKIDQDKISHFGKLRAEIKAKLAKISLLEAFTQALPLADNPHLLDTRIHLTLAQTPKQTSSLVLGSVFAETLREGLDFSVSVNEAAIRMTQTKLATPLEIEVPAEDWKSLSEALELAVHAPKCRDGVMKVSLPIQNPKRFQIFLQDTEETPTVLIQTELDLKCVKGTARLPLRAVMKTSQKGQLYTSSLTLGRERTEELPGATTISKLDRFLKSSLLQLLINQKLFETQDALGKKQSVSLQVAIKKTAFGQLLLSVEGKK